MSEGQLPELEHIHINEECLTIDHKAFAIRCITLEKQHMQEIFDKQLEKSLNDIHEKYAEEDVLLPF